MTNENYHQPQPIWLLFCWENRVNRGKKIKYRLTLTRLLLLKLKTHLSRFKFKRYQLGNKCKLKKSNQNTISNRRNITSTTSEKNNYSELWSWVVAILLCFANRVEQESSPERLHAWLAIYINNTMSQWLMKENKDKIECVIASVTLMLNPP